MGGKTTIKSPGYDALVERVRVAIGPGRDVSERRMFGGHCFLIGGHMACGVTGSAQLMVRVGPERYSEVLALSHALPMTFTGKPLRGFIYVDPAGHGDNRSLGRWVKLGTDFAAALPAKARAR